MMCWNACILRNKELVQPLGDKEQWNDQTNDHGGRIRWCDMVGQKRWGRVDIVNNSWIDKYHTGLKDH